MPRVYQEGNRLIRRQGAEILWIEPWGDNALRVRATKMGEMPNLPWALDTDPQSTAKISISPDQSGTVRNGNITAKLSPGGVLIFYNQRGEIILEEQWRTREIPEASRISALEIMAREFRPHVGGDYKLFVRFEPQKGEKIFGMGQYQDGILDRAGCSLELGHRNSQASVPFYLSNKGYGFFWNNPAIGRASFAKNGTEWVAESTKLMDYWIVAGDTPAQCEESYASVTGKAPMMPDYGMGFWQCKLRYRTQEELLEVAREYKRRGVPVDVIVSDFFHWPYQGDWHFDYDEWPDPEAMVTELEEMGTKLMVSIWPYVDTRSEHYEEMADRGLLARTERGVPYTMDFCGNTIPYDATNPEARDYVWNVVKENYYDKGIQVFWLDEAEPEYKIYDFDNLRYQAGSVLQVGNIYPVVYAKTFYEGMRAAGQEKVVNLLRCAWAGSQKYGALVWSGDIDSTFTSLKEQFASGLNMAMAGIPWWTTDIGGFHGGEQSDPDYRETLIRWFQFGAFCPVFRLHGYRKNGEPSLNPAKADTGGPNEIWSYGEEAYGILSSYIFLRERLRPYIEKTMLETSERGTPVFRPVFYDFPQDAQAWEVDDQYMFGNDILVAPVMDLGVRKRPVYLPAGTRWQNAWTEEILEGGQEVLADAPLSQIPLFVREGVKLPIKG